MKTLVIHPKDDTTDFLKPIYENIPNKTVITGGEVSEVYKQIELHDRIIMMGHGCPTGLFSVGRFVQNGKRAYGVIINKTTVPLLKEKECVFIWCNADQFVEAHNLKGFYSGMFVSEVGEARYCRVQNGTQENVDLSNNTFANIVGEVITNPLPDVYSYVMEKYGILAENNDVAKYNVERLYYNEK